AVHCPGCGAGAAARPADLFHDPHDAGAADSHTGHVTLRHGDPVLLAALAARRNGCVQCERIHLVRRLLHTDQRAVLPHLDIPLALAEDHFTALHDLHIAEFGFVSALEP